MENEILDYEEHKKVRPNYRKYYLIIETIIFLFIIYFWRRFDRIGTQHGLMLFAGFYFITPLIRYFLREINGILSFTLFSQNILVLCAILGVLFKIELWPGADELILIGSFASLFFIINPQLELKEKLEDNRLLRILVLFIGLGVFISFGGFIASILGHWFEMFFMLGNFICFALLLITLISSIRHPKEYGFLAYYIPRLILGAYQIIFLISSSLSNLL